VRREHNLMSRLNGDFRAIAVMKNDKLNGTQNR
jgi:hypothetical protein